MKTLLAPTEDFIKKDRSQLSAAATAGSTVTLNVVSAGLIAAHDFIVVGTEGTLTAEICQVSSVTETTIVVATLLNPHLIDEPITKYRYNKRKFYGATSAAGSYTELTSYGSPVAIDVDNPQGSSLEYTGGEGYTYFKATYYNSYDLTESNIADANAVLADESGRYCSIYSIRKQGGMTQNAYYDDGKVEEKRKQAENEVNSYIFEKYTIPLVNSVGVSEIPNLVQRCTILLAAGYIDYEEFGGEGQGVKWLGEARGILNSIQAGRQRLIDSTGSEFANKTRTQQLNGFPTCVDNENGPQRAFTRQQRF